MILERKMQINIPGLRQQFGNFQNNLKSVNLFRALFSPLLPPKCAYVQTFRVWLHKG